MEVEDDIWEMGGELQERELEILLKYIIFIHKLNISNPISLYN